MSALDRWLGEGWLRPLDHALGRTLIELAPATGVDVALAAALASRALAFGHAALPLARVGELLAEIAGDRVPPPLPDVDAWRAALAATPYVGDGRCAPADRPLVFDRDAIALRRYHDYETRLARALGALARPLLTPVDRNWLRARVAALFGDDALARRDAQALACATALVRGVVLLTGGPGTGKTTTVARLVALVVGHALARGESCRVALAAPTGKAAARLAEALRESTAALVARGALDAGLAAAMPADASTLHRLIGARAGSVRVRHDAADPLAADLVVVDEASMIDLPMMCKLVEAVRPGARLVLIGDRDQLPSVETGDVLAALCDAAGDGVRLPRDVAAELGALLGVDVEAAGDAPAPLVRVELTRSYRPSPELDSDALSARVRAGDADRVLADLRAGAYRGVDWREGGDDALAGFVLEHALPHYRALADADDIETALAEARRHRVLTAVREGDAGSRALNARMAEALQRDRVREGAFFHGRLVMIRENSYRHGLYNGDVGLAWSDRNERLRVWFDTADGPRTWLPAALPAHEDAFALTVHKSQGSEFDHVLLALPERGARVLSRELLYTGLTRAKRSLTLWANADVVAAAIARRAQRWSLLAGRLREG